MSTGILSKEHRVDRIFIINLKYRKDRKKHITQQMSEQGISNFEFFDAIRPTSEEVNEWSPTYCSIWYEFGAFSSMERYKNYQINALGCLKSHLGVVNLALSRGYERILILEDDIKFLRPWSSLKTYWPQTEFDILYLGGNAQCPSIPVPGREGLHRVASMTRADGYIITRRAMCFLSENIEGFNREIDTFYQWIIQPRAKCYCLVPSMIGQIDGFSDIQGTVVSYPAANNTCETAPTPWFVAATAAAAAAARVSLVRK